LAVEGNVGDDQKAVDFFERYTDSKAALFHQTESLVADIVERLPDAALDPAILSDQS
jgi:quinol monooxygenase YgiN